MRKKLHDLKVVPNSLKFFLLKRVFLETRGNIFKIGTQRDQKITNLYNGDRPV